MTSQQQASAEQLPLKKRILAWYQKQPGVWRASGDIQRLVLMTTSYTPANATRRLRELAEEGELSVEIRDGHAWYSYKPHHTKKVSEFIIKDGRSIEIIREITV